MSQIDIIKEKFGKQLDDLNDELSSREYIDLDKIDNLKRDSTMMGVNLSEEERNTDKDSNKDEEEEVFCFSEDDLDNIISDFTKGLNDIATEDTFEDSDSGTEEESDTEFNGFEDSASYNKAYDEARENAYNKEDNIDIGKEQTFSRKGHSMVYSDYTPAKAFDFQNMYDLTEDSAMNFGSLKKFITEDVLSTFHSIYQIGVQSEILIINNIAYKPQFSEEQLAKLPFQDRALISNGHLASLFHWGYLKECKDLALLMFDDPFFVYRVVRVDMGLNGDINPNDFFARYHSLIEIILGNSSFKRGDRENMSVDIFDRPKASARIMDGLEEMWSSLFHKSLDSFCDFYKTRGKRGFLGNAFGLVFKGGLVLTSGAINLVSHGARKAASTNMVTAGIYDSTHAIKEYKSSPKAVKRSEEKGIKKFGQNIKDAGSAMWEAFKGSY